MTFRLCAKLFIMKQQEMEKVHDEELCSLFLARNIARAIK
jgi:hypothetical protein